LKEKICVLKGGISPEREISLKSGKAVERGLREAGYRTFSLDSGKENFFNQLVEERPDAVFIALHGTCGEDGTVQGWLELAGITYTGSGVLASALAMDKANSRRILISEGIPFPRFREVERGREDEISLRFPLPWVVKPVRGGSTLGVSLVKEEGKLRDALKEAFRYDSSCAIIEEYIPGREITVGIIDDPEPKVLPIIEILSKNELYDYEAKYTDGFCEFVVPASLKKDEYLKAGKYNTRHDRKKSSTSSRSGRGNKLCFTCGEDSKGGSEEKRGEKEQDEAIGMRAGEQERKKRGLFFFLVLSAFDGNSNRKICLYHSLF